VSIFGGRSEDGGKGFDWSFASVKDPRFRGSGNSFGLFGSHDAISKRIKELEEIYKRDAPDDIEYEGWKR
jgi:hypothetical protein